jgi:hypothetical protein
MLFESLIGTIIEKRPNHLLLNPVLFAIRAVSVKSAREESTGKS